MSQSIQTGSPKLGPCKNDNRCNHLCNHPRVTRILQALPKSVFIHMCTFLSMKDKCATMLQTNTVSRGFFKKNNCFSTDKLVLDLNHPKTVEYLSFLLKYAALVCAIEFIYKNSIRLPHSALPDVLSSLVEAMKSSTSLKSLSIDETTIEPPECSEKPFFTQRLIDEFEFKTMRWDVDGVQETDETPHHLESLSIKISMEAESDGTEHHFLTEIAALIQGSSLLTLVIDAEPCWLDFDDYSQLVQSLPSSLTSCILSRSFTEPDDCVKDVWYNCLARAHYLPNIRHIMFGKLDNRHNTDTMETGQWLNVTTCTGNQRPWTTLPLNIINDSLTHVHLSHLKVLILSVCQSGFGIFSALGEECMPVLEEVAILKDNVLPSYPTDIAPFITFISTRPIQRMTLLFSDLSSDDWTPLSDASVQALGRMHTLKFFLWCGPCRQRTELAAFRCQNMSALIAPSCWSQLNHIRLTGVGMSLEHVDTLLRGAPSLLELNLALFSTKIPHFPLHVLTSVARHCPLVSHLIVFGQPLAELEFREAQVLLGNCPPLLNIKEMVVGRIPMTEKCQHLLFSKLRQAPLTHLELFLTSDHQSLQTVLFRSITRLNCVVDALWTNNYPKFRSRRMAKGTTFKFFKSENRPGRLVSKSDYDCVTFNPEMDDRGKSGRECFFEALYQSLPLREKRMIDAWDAGDYSVGDM